MLAVPAYHGRRRSQPSVAVSRAEDERVFSNRSLLKSHVDQPLLRALRRRHDAQLLRRPHQSDSTRLLPKHGGPLSEYVLGAGESLYVVFSRWLFGWSVNRDIGLHADLPSSISYTNPSPYTQRYGMQAPIAAPAFLGKDKWSLAACSQSKATCAPHFRRMLLTWPMHRLPFRDLQAPG